MNEERPAALCLALCSATRTASVALLRGDRVLVEHSAQTDRHQSESLLPLVDLVLRDAAASVDDLDCIGLSIGPGSFTSLRIGVSTVKGLVYGTELPVVGVSTLRVLAEAVAIEADTIAPSGSIIGTLNAQREEVYAAAFSGMKDGFAPKPDVLPELVYNAKELADALPAGCVLAGEGVSIVSKQLAELRGEELAFIEAVGREPTAGGVGRLAVAQWASEGGTDAADLAPRYVRRAEAEVTRTAERFEPPADG